MIYNDFSKVSLKVCHVYINITLLKRPCFDKNGFLLRKYLDYSPWNNKLSAINRHNKLPVNIKTIHNKIANIWIKYIGYFALSKMLKDTYGTQISGYFNSLNLIQSYLIIIFSYRFSQSNGHFANYALHFYQCHVCAMIIGMAWVVML